MVQKSAANSLSRSSRLARRFGWALSFATVACALVAPTGFAKTDLQADDGGLNAIIGAETPEGITEFDFASLGAQWTEWSTGVTAALKELYEGQGTTAARQRELLDTIDRSVADARRRSVAPEESQMLNELLGRVQRRVTLTRAVLSALGHSGPSAGDRLASAASMLRSDIEAVERYLGRIGNGDLWVSHLDLPTLKQQAAGAGEGLQRETLNRTMERVSAYAAADEETKTFLERPQIKKFAGSLASVVQTMEQSQPGSANPTPPLKGPKGAAINEFEVTRSEVAAVTVRNQLNELEALDPAAAAVVSDAILVNYMNYNFRVVTSEGFVERLVNERRLDSGSVRDCILGARVTGCQCTTTDVSIDFVPNHGQAQFKFNISGNVRSNTRGVTDQATIYTQGNHYFTASKDVYYDGHYFAFGRPSIGVDANNRNTGARINSNFFLARLFDKVALRKANEKRPQAEAIAASRVRDRILPQFNNDLEERFGEASGKLQTKVYGPLADLGMSPDVMTFSTTSDLMKINARVMGADELAADRPASLPIPTRGAVVEIHESWLNNTADAIGLAGRTMTETEVRNLVRDRITQLLGREPKFEQDPANEDGTAFIFAAEDPVRFRIENGRIVLVIRTGLKRPDDEPIPVQQITVPLQIVMEPGQIRLVREPVIVEQVEKSSLVLRKLLGNKLEEAIDGSEIDRTVTVDGDSRSIRLHVLTMDAQDGWLTLSAE